MRYCIFLGAMVSVSILFLTGALPRAEAAKRPGGDLPLPPTVRPQPSPYYELYSDLEGERLQEAVLRMSRMVEEYRERTKEFSGAIKTRFPFFLFSSEMDYVQFGGPPGSSGVFVSGSERGDYLMAIAEPKNDRETWHTVQHEGFHQFAHAVIRGDLPTWLNEGLAEYFGEGIWTGDGMVTGVIPPQRLLRMQRVIEAKRFRPLRDMMMLSHRQWNFEADPRNYDMAWTMVHFLAHGDDGKYQAAFAKFIRDLGAGKQWPAAWADNFGSTENLEKLWAAWWLAQKPTTTIDLYTKATVAKFCSYLGRAAKERQTYDNFEEFFKAAEAGTVKLPKDDWLPSTLLQTAVKSRLAFGDKLKFSIAKEGRNPQVIAITPDDVRITGTFNMAAPQGLTKVVVSVDDTSLKIAQAKTLIEANKKVDARTLLQAALKQNSKSPLVEDIRKLIKTTFQ